MSTETPSTDAERSETAVAQQAVVSQRFVWRKHWDSDESHAPYWNEIHSVVDDVSIGQWFVLSELFEAVGMEDGDEFEITIRRTGEKPFPHQIWKLVEAHTYAPVPKVG